MCANETKYIGRTNSFGRRYLEHSRDGGKMGCSGNGGCQATFHPDIVIRDPKRRNEVEKILIQKETPDWNKTNNPNWKRR
jgi:hypothetical protein